MLQEHALGKNYCDKNWFLGERNIFLCLVLRKQRTDFPDPEVEFLALAMLPGLMAIAVTDKSFPPPDEERTDAELWLLHSFFCIL